ncbi:hypothetical protein PINS_up022220 [Pythium insidiosum]|nr:hypothetical protein PINS_up022220 [Pythium insidiosum]
MSFSRLPQQSTTMDPLSTGAFEFRVVDECQNVSVTLSGRRVVTAECTNEAGEALSNPVVVRPNSQGLTYDHFTTVFLHQVHRPRFVHVLPSNDATLRQL